MEKGYKSLDVTLDASSKSFLIVSGRFNDVFSNRLIDGAVDALLRHGASSSSITVTKVPGCFELPLACLEAAESKNYDAIIAVGALIEGETDHYKLIASEVSSGISEVNRRCRVPVTFGVITAKNMEQAMARSGSKVGNLGYEAAIAAIEMANLVSVLRKGD